MEIKDCTTPALFLDGDKVSVVVVVVRVSIRYLYLSPNK